MPNSPNASSSSKNNADYIEASQAADSSHLASVSPNINSPATASAMNIPIRLPRNSTQNNQNSSLYHDATQALSDLPSSLSSSVGRTTKTIWDLEYSKPQLDSSDASFHHHSDNEPHLLRDSVKFSTPAKYKVTFKNSSDNLNSSDFAGSYDLDKKEAAKLLKRHLVTKNTNSKHKKHSISSQASITEDNSHLSSKKNISTSYSSHHSDVVKATTPKSALKRSLNSIEHTQKNTPNKNKQYSYTEPSGNHSNQSEAEEYDRLLDSQESDYDDNEDLTSNTDEEQPSSSKSKRQKKTKKVLINPLTLQSGDITHSLYKWQAANSNDANLKRNKSYIAPKSALTNSNQDWGVPFASSDITQPGGFRRYFMRERAIREGRSLPDSMTSNFVDFISLYGHFAGGEYPSDEDEVTSDYDMNDDAEQYLDFVNRERFRRASGQYGDSNSVFSVNNNGVITDIPTTKHEGTASSKKAFFLLIKSFVGTGILFLPKSFYNGGLLFSIILMMVTAFLALHCMLLLIECHSKLKMSYGNIGYYLVGKKTRDLVFFSIVLSQIGFCCAYSIFVATNTQFLFNSITKCSMDLPLSFWILVQFVFYIPISMVRKIKNFSILALVADVFIVIGLAYLFYYDGFILATEGIADIKLFNPVTFPLLIGTAVFSFEGIGLVIPVIDSMKTPSDFPKVLSLTVFISASLFIAAASLSYMAFGDKVETVILLNFTSGGSFTSFIQFLYSLAIVFSVPLQLFPAIRILESGLFTKSGKRNPMVKWQKNAFRLVLCLVIAAISIMVADQLDEFVSVIGTFACVPLSFIYPTLFHYLAIDSSKIVKIKNLFLFFFGILVMFYVTNLTLQQWGSSKPSLPQCPRN
ncbi:hypothetical protein BB561_003524 [Smittium simulii]|uniref:Amino acid transporter transmembrane domain-containing protein n=1 Tax=Smittium simulii TaxID=133385 RepID=A0A2T9YKZ2_9FUNG|nr:hypothetical protein BB561_003524 [Smittium simulii]